MPPRKPSCHLLSHSWWLSASVVTPRIGHHKPSQGIYAAQLKCAPDKLLIPISPPSSFSPQLVTFKQGTTMAERYYIPKNLEKWKWPRRINPHYSEVRADSAAWIRSLKAFSPKAQEAFDRADFSTRSYVYSDQVHILIHG
jgi:hypothetical protein